jgi:hypothetical protein
MSKEEKSQDITPSVGPADDSSYVDFFADWFVLQSQPPATNARYDRLYPTVCRRGVVVYHSTEASSIKLAEKEYQHLKFMLPDEYLETREW